MPDLCLVAMDGPNVVGHIAFSRAGLESGHEVIALGPMAVFPDHQQRGFGSALVTDSLRRAAETDFALIVVVGHPEYYPRFGFEPAAPLGISAPFDVAAEAWMAYRLPAYEADARGLVKYAGAFTG